MKFQVSDGEKDQKILEVEVPVEEMELPLRLAAKRLAEKVNIPGFRKGKAPRSVLESFIGVQSILDEAVDEILPKAYADGLKETGIEPVAPPQVEIITLEKDQPLVFKATITVKPEVRLGQYKELAITRTTVEVSDEDVDKELENRRQRLTKLTDVEEGAAAKNGDTVTIDFRGMKDGVAFDGGTAEGYVLELGSGSFIPGFEQQVEGMKVGEERNIEVTFPEEYQEPSLAGQPVVFEIKLHKIQQKVLPELDQAFVEEVSETAENLDQLKAEIRTRLEEQSQAMSTDNARNQALIAAVDNAEVDIPPVMVEQEIDRIIEDTERNMQQQGLSLEQYLQYVGGSMEDFRSSYKERAEFMVKRELVLEAIAKAEDFQVSEEDVDAEIERMAAQYFRPAASIRDILEQQGSIDDLKYSMKMNKATEFVFEQAVITEELVDRAAIEARMAAEAAAQAAAEIAAQGAAEAETVEEEEKAE